MPGERGDPVKKRTPTHRMSEDEFINSATSHTLPVAVPAPEAKPAGRKRTYKAISVSLTDNHIEAIDEVIVGRRAAASCASPAPTSSSWRSTGWRRKAKRSCWNC